jgi:hypothetical protein
VTLVENLVPDDHIVVLFGGTGDSRAVEQSGGLRSTASWQAFAANLSVASPENSSNRCRPSGRRDVPDRLD